MVCGTTEEKGKGKKKYHCQHGKSKCKCTECGGGEGPSVTMINGNTIARNVVGGAIASMTKINSTARIVVVACCARPHTVLP